MRKRSSYATNLPPAIFQCSSHSDRDMFFSVGDVGVIGSFTHEFEPWQHTKCIITVAGLIIFLICLFKVLIRGIFQV